MAERETCEDCQYFSGFADNRCHLNPPVVLPDGSQRWPEVYWMTPACRHLKKKPAQN